MLELLAIATGVELGKFVLNQVLDLSKPVLESYVQDFFKDCLDGGVARLKTNTLKQPMAEAIGFFIQRFIKELQFYDVPDTSINHYYKSAIKQFVRDKAVGSILGQAFETSCKKIDSAQLETIWMERYPQQGWQFPAEDFDWRGVTKEYVVQVKSIVKANVELRALLETDLLEELVNNTAQLSPGFDIIKYRESLQTSYGYLKLHTLDGTHRADPVKLWHMFIEQTVRAALPPSLYDLPLDLRRQFHEQKQLRADLPAEVLEIYRREYFQQPTSKVLKAVAESKWVVILGDPGSGKSTLLQYLALKWVEQQTTEFPLLIELREYALSRASNFLEFLHKGHGVDWQFDQIRLHEQLNEQPTLVMFDGLDEVFDRPTQAAISDDIIRFAQKYPLARIIITSRIIGYNPERFQHATFRQFTLQPLDETEIHEFIDRWYDLSMGGDPDKVRLKQRLKDAITNSKAIQNLADNPLLLTMMAILNRRQELPRDRADLYDQASRVLLYHWDVDHKRLNLPIDAIGRREKQDILRAIAYEMQAGKEGLKGNLISADHLIHILTNYLRNEGYSESREKANRLVQQLRERNFILCYRGADTYGFMHRTFLEYFCAIEIVYRFEKQRTLSFEQLRDEIFGQGWADEANHEVLQLVCSMLSVQIVGKIISFLISQDGWQGRSRNLFLAAKCFNEVRNRTGLKIIENELIVNLKDVSRIKYAGAKIALESFLLILEIWKDEETLLPFIAAKADPGEDWLPELEEIQIAAIRALSENWRTQPITLRVLKKQILVGENSLIRKVALQSFCITHPNEPITKALLYNRANNDNDKQLRQWAQEQLDKLEIQNTL